MQNEKLDVIFCDTDVVFNSFTSANFGMVEMKSNEKHPKC